MGVASSTSANNKYYRDHVEDIVNNYPAITMYGKWKFWSGRSITVTSNGETHIYPVDYVIESAKSSTEEDAISVNMSALWPDKYPMTAFRGRFNEITWVYFTIYPKQNKITIQHTYDASRQDLTDASPEEINATKSLLNESVCILLRMAQQAQKRDSMTMVTATVFPEDKGLFEELGFTVESISPLLWYEMTGALDTLVHKCRQEHLFRGTSVERVPRNRRIAGLLRNLANINTPGKWQFSSGRTVAFYDGNKTQEYPIEYEMALNKFTPNIYPLNGLKVTETITLKALWPRGYPNTQFKTMSTDCMMRLDMDVCKDRIIVKNYSYDLYKDGTQFTSIAFASKATPAEKAVLPGLLSEGLCLMLRMIQQWGKLPPQTRVETIVGYMKAKNDNIDHIPHNTAQERTNALRKYKGMIGLPFDQQLMAIKIMVATEAEQKIYEDMGFHVIGEPRTPYVIEMESTIGVLVENCEHRFVEDKDYV